MLKQITTKITRFAKFFPEPLRPQLSVLLTATCAFSLRLYAKLYLLLSSATRLNNDRGVSPLSSQSATTRRKRNSKRNSRIVGSRHFCPAKPVSVRRQLLCIYTRFVYTVFVKNITLSADEHLIEQARQTARAQHKTLNAAFREWLEDYVGKSSTEVAAFDELMARLRRRGVRSNGPYTRDEMNER